MLSNEKSLLQSAHSQGSPEQKIIESENPEQIPRKKPHFRNVNYDRLSRAKQIRVKFWKFHSCNLSNFNSEFESKIRTTEDRRKENEKKKKFEKTLNHLTIKRGLKFVKRVHWNCKLLSKNKFFVELCKLWRLETLDISIVPDNKPCRLLKALLNSKLKDCFLIFGSGQTPCDLDPILISSFRRLKRSHLFVINNPQNLKMLLDTDSLLPYHQSRQFTPRMQRDGFEFISNQIIINSLNSFQKISYQCTDNTLPDLPSLPNLKELQFAWTFTPQNERFVDISFVKQYSKLESLSVKFDFCHPETLDYLADLPCLKEFYFSSKQAQMGENQTRTLPNLTKLEKFGLCLNEPTTIFSIENIRDFISKNKSLQSLDLSLSIQNIGAILNNEDENVTLPLPPIRKFRLNFSKCEESDVEAANRIIKTLQKCDSIKQLSLEFQQSSAELNTIFFKEGLISMKSLENFTLKYCTLGKLERNNFGYLKDVFATFENLRALDLDFGQEALGPQEFGSILDALCQLKHLEKFRFQAKVIQFTATAYKQLLGFLTSIRHVKSLDFNLQGLSKVDGSRLRKNLHPKFTLSQSSFSFAFWA